MSKMMTVEKVVQETLEAMERTAKKATRSPQAARAFLRRAGISASASTSRAKARR
jgi:hypothetical protein